MRSHWSGLRLGLNNYNLEGGSGGGQFLYTTKWGRKVDGAILEGIV